LGYAPLYVGFFDLFETVMILKSILENKEYLSVDQSKKTVT
jgi:kynureninase